MHGKSGVAKFGGTKVARITGWNYEDENDLIDATYCTASQETYEIGWSRGSGTIDCNFYPADFISTGASGIAVASMDNETSVELDLLFDEDTTTGAFVGMSGTTYIANASYTLDRNDIVKCSFSFKGVLTRYSG